MLPDSTMDGAVPGQCGDNYIQYKVTDLFLQCYDQSQCAMFTINLINIYYLLEFNF